LSATLQEPDVAASGTPPPGTHGAGAVHDNQFVTFNVAGEMFAVPMAPVQEIIRVPEVHACRWRRRRWTA
jgi:hypothetical protein